ncbi:hypothetical protein GCM10009682_00890 [Luedemannella flava]|uniref:DUF2637 domain-containing protein n=1 Tax=Luedemannella flava TaxID=349316 RepID=A0ABP4XH03_9ACTN
MTTNANLAHLRRIRWAVRATLVLGVAASVAANILHAESNPVSQTIAAWPPLALLLTVELVSRVPAHRRSLAALRLCATAAIAGIAAWVSYWHMVGVASHYGEVGASPYLLPFSVDGLVVVASVSLVELAGRIRSIDQAPAVPAASPAVLAVQPQDGPGTAQSSAVLGEVVDGRSEDQVLTADLLTLARTAAETHRLATGRPITRDQLRSVLRVANGTASELYRQIRGDGAEPGVGLVPVPPETFTRHNHGSPVGAAQ